MLINGLDNCLILCTNKIKGLYSGSFKGTCKATALADRAT